MSEPWTEAQLDSVRRLRYDHGGEHPVPIGAASSVEAISWLHWAPLPPSVVSQSELEELIAKRRRLWPEMSQLAERSVT